MVKKFGVASLRHTEARILVAVLLTHAPVNEASGDVIEYVKPSHSDGPANVDGRGHVLLGDAEQPLGVRHATEVDLALVRERELARRWKRRGRRRHRDQQDGDEEEEKTKTKTITMVWVWVWITTSDLLQVVQPKPVPLPWLGFGFWFRINYLGSLK